jgi:RimJ/RimL family protein N-acetyltransferase
MVSLESVVESGLEELAAFLASEEWPFHGNPRPDEDTARRWALEERRFSGPGARAFWIVESGERVGVAALQELEDLTPVFDLRLAAAARGRGLGRRAVGLLAARLFEETDRNRLEAHVRADNAAMRRCLEAAGAWVQEAHHREAWPDAAGVMHDCVTYGLLRRDWTTGRPTPVPPLDEPKRASEGS